MIRELKMSRYSRGGEFCYERSKNVVKLYDDAALPRLHIATITFDILEGWTWVGEGGIISNWQDERGLKNFKIALYLAAHAYNFKLHMEQDKRDQVGIYSPAFIKAGAQF